MPRIGTVIREVYRRPGADELPGHLEQRYGIRVTQVTNLDGGVFKVERDGGPPWVARLHLSSRPPARTEADAEVLRFLERQGFPAERCAHPEPVSVLDGRAVLVTDFVPGQRPPGSPAIRRRLGDLLGRLCALPAAEPEAVRRPAGSLHHLPMFEGAPGQDLAAAAALLDDLDGRVPPQYRQVHDALREMLPLGDGAAGLPEAFIHPDPARSNVITDPGTPDPVLVDWTGAGTGPRLAALAVLLNSVAPQHVAEVLTGFRARTGDLTAEELDRLEGVLWIRPLWLACWQCWLAVVSAKVSRAFLPDREHITALAAAVRAAQPARAQERASGQA
jgi:Ser/Thr protein kinase RdoA (MazF antagonist)